MSIQRNVTEIFIGAGAGLSANNTALNAIAVQTGVVGSDMLTLDPSGTDTISTAGASSIYIVNKKANGDYKLSNKIAGTSVVGYRAESYQPARRCVWGFGYTRAHLTNPDTSMSTATAAAGSIEVNASTEYIASIIFTNDKSFYSVRPERLPIVFTSASNATQLTIATQLAGVINGSAWGSAVSGVKEIVAVVVGDGTGAYGLTGATNYGVEVTGLVINQFANTQYQEELVNFNCHVDDSSGFGTTTTCSQIQTMKKGTGTYNQVYNLENKYYGLLNRTTWPIPTQSFLASSTGTTSGAFTLTSATTTGLDVVTFSNATVNTQLFPGSIVSLDGVTYEIKYWESSTVVVLTSPATTTNATGAVTGTAFYDMFNITVDDVTRQDGSGVGQLSRKNIMIATPAIVSGATGNTAMSTASTESANLQTVLNAWMASTPLAPIAIAV